MGRDRDNYLFKIQHNTKTPQEFLEGLAASPYKTHRRMAVYLANEILSVTKEQSESHTETI